MEDFLMTMETVRKWVGETSHSVAQGAWGWAKTSDMTWGVTGVIYYGTQLATNQKWMEGVEASHAGALVFAAISICTIAQHTVFAKPVEENAKPETFSTLKNRNLILIANTGAVALFGAQYFNLKVPAFRILAAAALIYKAGACLHGYYVNRTSLSSG
jgi:hypothetical protein